MRVVVAIVGFRNADDIKLCLARLAASTYTNFEVVICENGGPAAFAELSSAVPPQLTSGQSVTLIEAPGNLGYAGGVNTCLQASPDADAWWVLNPDTEPHCRALAALAARLAIGDVAAVGGVLHDERGRVQNLGGRWRAWLGRSESIGHGCDLAALPALAEVEQQLGFLSGASMLVGRALTARIGLMREDYFLYAEELEWFVRARAAGLRLGFAPEARVLHHQGSTTGSGAARKAKARLPVYLETRNALHVVRDTTPRWLLNAAAAAPVLLAARYARAGAWRQYRWALEGVAAALRNERGPPPWLRL